MQSIVVVINSFRRSPELVARSLRAVLSQSIKPLKLILLDQNSNPISLPSDIEDNPIFERQKCPFQSVSEARNSVNLPSECSWISFCDDDGYWAQDFSETLQPLLGSDLDVIAGSVLREDTMDFYSLRHRIGGNLSNFRNLKLLMGSNFLVRKSLFDQVGRFDPRFGVGAYWGSSEETDFAWKCYFAKAQMQFIPELQVVHIPPFNESFEIGLRKSYKYAVGKGALVSKWLLEKHQPLVLWELVEMLVVPPVQITRGVLTLKPSLALNNFGVWWGRLFGFFLFPFTRNKKP